MWQQRLGRLLMIVVGAALIILLVKSFSSRPENLAFLGKMINLPQVIPSNQETEGILNKILGQTTKEEINPEELVSRVDQEEEETIQVNGSGEVEPIAEPVENVRHQSQLLLEMIKKLPEEQLEAVKRQLCKELCGE